MTQFDNLLFQIPGVETSQGYYSSEWLQEGWVSLTDQSELGLTNQICWEWEIWQVEEDRKLGMQEKIPLRSEETTEQAKQGNEL